MGRSFLASTLFHVVLLTLFAVGLELSVRAPVQEAIPIEVVDAASLGPAEPTPPKPAPAATAPLPARDAARPVPPPPPPAPPAPAEPPPPPKAAEAPPPPPEPKVAPPEPKVAEPLPPKVPDKPKPIAATPPKPEAPPPKVPEKPKEPEKPKVAEKPKEAPPKPAPQAPKPPAPDKKVAEKPKPDTKPAKTKADSKAEPDPLDTLLASVEKLDKRVKGDVNREGKGNAKEAGSPDKAKSTGPANLTAGELAGIKRQIEQCWNVPVGVEGIEDMQVKLRILMNPDGTAGKVSVEDQARMTAEPGFRTVAESARRAVLGCRLTLPAEKYDLWKDMVMTFYPKDAISG